MRTTAAVLLLFTTTAGFAAGGPGTSGSPFLKIPLSGRATGLGGAYGAVSGDVATLDYNPAGLAGLVRTDLQVSYLDYFEDTSLQLYAVGFPVGLGQQFPIVNEPGEFQEHKLGVGVSYRLLSAEDTSRDTAGIEGEDFDVRDQVLTAGAAYPIIPNLSLGASVKMISSKIENKSAKTYAGDVGLLFKGSRQWRFGLAAQNIGSGPKFETEADDLPTVSRASVGYETQSLLLLADVAAGKDGVIRESGGAEWALASFISLRAGVFHATTLEFTGGLGLRLNGPQKAAQSTSRPVSNPRTIDQLEKSGRPKESRGLGSPFPNLSLGLDYGLATSKDLGITHNITVRILY